MFLQRFLLYFSPFFVSLASAQCVPLRIFFWLRVFCCCSVCTHACDLYTIHTRCVLVSVSDRLRAGETSLIAHQIVPFLKNKNENDDANELRRRTRIHACSWWTERKENDQEFNTYAPMSRTFLSVCMLNSFPLV